LRLHDSPGLLLDWDGQQISLYLPVILRTEKGIEVFSAEAFHHDNEGEHVIDVNGQTSVTMK
jgi:F-type H+-transporting ATPase subunit a